ncbi:aspartate aminotransferase family protein [Cellulomonas soli]|uniref:Aspartate aminotransferase family protein n=1 Tax=Cellulomonas soli TaxID=931535 RepID=A0A512PA28_9CELL|nr:aspartate aminotransferase family protein [Cellulomonas soli]NYI60546.1 adenosylmethionine-8-amino-7-oxononanoate aminotransferase [Cellulomonas soli]GEP68061.1 aspartate aminotransferase family protein [Cellulomonas soli]
MTAVDATTPPSTAPTEASSAQAPVTGAGVTRKGTPREVAAGRHLWGHFTRQDAWDRGEVTTIVRAEGEYLWDQNGHRLFDGLSGLFVVQVGHGRHELAEAAAKQARDLAFFPVWGYAHTPGIDLAERLADYAPGDLNHVFYTTGGSEAVETAWKLAKQYWQLVGKPGKRKVLSRDGAYHGTTHGALSLTRIGGYQAPYTPLVEGASQVPNTNAYRSQPQFWDDQVAYGRWAADEVERQILAEGPDTVAALFVEPVQNSGGCFVPPPGYFARVREICDRYDVLLVSDEVICAYGRTGGIFASADLGYVPDIITSSKGLTSGYSPIGAVLVSDRVYEPYRRGEAVFTHGYTFGGHPVSSAVALANLDILEREGLVDRVRTLGPAFKATLERLYDIPIVGDVRGAGYFLGLELTRDPATRERFTEKESDRLRAFLNPALYEAGLYCRADDRGDVVIQLAPPLTSGQAEFDLIESILRDVLVRAASRL